MANVCDAEYAAFKAALGPVQEAMQAEIQQVADETEKKTTTLSDDFKSKNDTAAGVGAAMGAVAGGVAGGPEGAAVGAVVGKAIGKFFTMEFGEEQIKFSFDVPEVTVKDQEFSMDVPEVTLNNQDIIFNLPTMVMKDVPGPPVPHVVVRWNGPFPETTVEWDNPTISVPTWENREQRVVIGIPEVTMQTRKITVGIPEFTMKRQDVIFTIPTITIKFVQDASKELAAKANDIANDCNAQIAQKKATFKIRAQQELVGPANKMFSCYRSQINSGRDQAFKIYNDQLNTVTNSIIAGKKDGLPDTDPHIVESQAKADNITKKMNESLKVFDDALAALDASSKSAVDDMFK